MATDPDRQRHGVGASVIDAARGVVAERGGVLLWCHARASAERFYLNTGWHSHGALFTENALPHRCMWTAVGKDPAEV